MTPSEYAEAFSGFNPRPEDVNRHRALGGREPQPERVRSLDVADTTADDLATSVRDLALSVAGSTVTRSERLSRLELLAATTGHLTSTLRLLDPYTRTGSRLADLALCHNPRSDVQGKAEAAARLAAHAQFTRAWADLAPLLDHGVVHKSGTGVSDPGGLLAIATPAGELGPKHLSALPIAGELPVAELDPTTETQALAYRSIDVTRTEVPWHVSAIAANMARQILDWAEAGQDELDRLLSLAVNRTLEAALFDDLTTTAVPAADLDAAEAAALAAWPSGGPVLVIHAPEDRPIVRKAYTGLPAEYWPTLVASSAATAGTAHVAARDALVVEASALDVLAVDEPSLLGKGVAFMRYGRALPRVAAAVQTVTL